MVPAPTLLVEVVPLELWFARKLGASSTPVGGSIPPHAGTSWRRENLHNPQEHVRLSMSKWFPWGRGMAYTVSSNNFLRFADACSRHGR
jgi:hypothetical protein